MANIKSSVSSASMRHSRWLLHRLLDELHHLMGHPWVQIVGNQAFSAHQYTAWLARLRAAFSTLEQHVGSPLVEQVHDAGLLRTAALEADLSWVLGSEWHIEAAETARGSPATQKYLACLEADAADAHALLAHHFMWYFCLALSGGSVHMCEAVAKRWIAPLRLVDVHFYTFAGAVAMPGPSSSGWGPTRLGQYLRDFDALNISDEGRSRMLDAMRHTCSSVEAMMGEVCKANATSALRLPYSRGHQCSVDLNLLELRQHSGAQGKPILLGIAGEVLDVSSSAGFFGPGGGYAALAGRDVTRCLATMSLEATDLDDVDWEACVPEDREALEKWREALKTAYPVVGRLKRRGEAEVSLPTSHSWRWQSSTALGCAPATSSSSISSVGRSRGSCVSTANAVNDVAGQRCVLSASKSASFLRAVLFGISTPKLSRSGPALVGTIESNVAGAVQEVRSSSCFITYVRSSVANEESLLYALCPSNWDNKTYKVLICWASAAFIGGACVGWTLARSLPLLRRKSLNEQSLPTIFTFISNRGRLTMMRISGGLVLITALWLRRRFSVQ